MWLSSEEPATNWSGAVSRLSGRKDNPYTVILELVMRKEENSLKCWKADLQIPSVHSLQTRLSILGGAICLILVKRTWGGVLTTF